jgi:hypothetical protein
LYLSLIEPNLSEKLYPLENALSINEQISNWLTSLNYECSTTRQGADLICVLNVTNAGKEQLTLILIDLDIWQTTNAHEHWEEYIRFTQSLRAKGKNCIVIWEDFWIRSREIVQSRILSMLGRAHRIPARLTQVRRIDKPTADAFLEKNHLNGTVSAKYKYGLFLPFKYYRVLNEGFKPVDRSELLVAVATFSFPRLFTKNNHTVRSHELVRFASLLHTSVVGGLDKLLQAFVKDKQPDDIMTYADLEWSIGKSYEKLGFEEKSSTGPTDFFLNLPEMKRSSLPFAEALPQLNIRNMGSIKFVKTINEYSPE